MSTTPSRTKFELYPLTLLAEDINEKNPPQIAAGFAGITLAYNVKSEAEVHEVMELAKKAGAVIAQEHSKFSGAGTGVKQGPGMLFF
ncbi:hypothetical protein [Acetonema longum]|uniref:Glyoxalase/bleomycin resistance protein/dioxygenase n=1 Tax=Acetonema longum DSM 6540 TaxID=1009370 RepID=F7NJJ7_9FIRM|nr:hypothetical protein [Acetonema longum]EGO63783.1 Glyoxalase/bleomycin resistance protein/dioxygenase [Acetonema longum DSM 6540]